MMRYYYFRLEVPYINFVCKVLLNESLSLLLINNFKSEIIKTKKFIDLKLII